MRYKFRLVDCEIDVRDNDTVEIEVAPDTILVINRDDLAHLEQLLDDNSVSE